MRGHLSSTVLLFWQRQCHRLDIGDDFWVTGKVNISRSKYGGSRIFKSLETVLLCARPVSARAQF